LHSQRFKERGYNQAECIARGLAAGLNKPLIPHGFVKNKSTDSLINQDRSQRFNLLKDSFEVNDNFINKHPLIVDDTLTTGSTLLAAGEK